MPRYSPKAQYEKRGIFFVGFFHSDSSPPSPASLLPSSRPVSPRLVTGNGSVSYIRQISGTYADNQQQKNEKTFVSKREGSWFRVLAFISKDLREYIAK